MRISSHIREPSQGWNGLNGSMVGVVSSITLSLLDDERVTVEFPDNPEWEGKVSEVERWRTPEKGDFVQVIRRLSKVHKSNTHDDIPPLRLCRVI